MKNIFIIAFTFLATYTFAQSPAKKVDEISTITKAASDSIRIIYAVNTGNVRIPAYFLNGKFLHPSVMATLNPNQIEDIKIVKENIKINGIEYDGQILLKTKVDFSPKIISLNNLKDKYTKLKNKSTLFMIDGKIINDDYDKYMVAEDYILSIIIDKIENTKENINLNLIKLLTKSAENIKKSKEIWLRGSNGGLSK